MRFEAFSWIIRVFGTCGTIDDAHFDSSFTFVMTKELWGAGAMASTVQIPVTRRWALFGLFGFNFQVAKPRIKHSYGSIISFHTKMTFIPKGQINKTHQNTLVLLGLFRISIFDPYHTYIRCLYNLTRVERCSLGRPSSVSGWRAWLGKRGEFRWTASNKMAICLCLCLKSTGSTLNSQDLQGIFGTMLPWFLPSM